MTQSKISTVNQSDNQEWEESIISGSGQLEVGGVNQSEMSQSETIVIYKYNISLFFIYHMWLTT